MKNKRFVIAIILNALLLGLLIFFIVKYAKSFGIYDDGYGTEIYSDPDWLVLCIVDLFMLSYGLYSLRQIYKNEIIKQNFSTFICLSISAIASFYPLGVFIKAMVKGKKYVDNQWYLYIGLFGTILLCLSIIAAIRLYKINKASR